MKKISLCLITIILLFLISCGGSDSEDTINQAKKVILKFGTSEISINTLESVDIPIEYSGVDISDCKDSVDNNFYVNTYKSKGNLNVYALYVGTCKVYILHNGIKDSCKINITPKYNGVGYIYDNVGSSQDELIKAKKDVYTVSYTDNFKTLNYAYRLNGTEYEEKYYIDSNNKISTIISDITFYKSDGYKDIIGSMYERYKYLSTVNTTNSVIYWFKGSNGHQIRLIKNDSYHFQITYL